MTEFLNDVWIQLTAYYEDVVILFPKVVISVAVLLLLWGVSGLVIKKTRPLLLAKLEDPLVARFIVRVVKVIFFIIAFLLCLKILGLGGIAAGLLGTAGVGAFVIGFALKDIFEHFLAGFLLAFNRPFRIGDVVELDENKGTVVALNIRNTHIKSFDGQDVYIPNGNIIKNALRNYTIDGYMRYNFNVKIESGADISRACEIILSTVKRVPKILQDEKPPFVNVDSVGSQVVTLSVFFWLDISDPDTSAAKVTIDAVDRVLHALDEADFYLPGDVVEIRNKATT